jgi:death on curing protein
MKWLTRQIVEAFHRESLLRFGGAHGLRDEGLLESALARLRTILGYEPKADLFRLAAAYGYGVIRNHPFVDGNKRTGVLCAYACLAMNGVEPGFDEAEIVNVILGVAAGEIGEAELANWLRSSVQTDSR